MDETIYRLAGLDWSKHYAAIGEFVVTFEKIPTAFRLNYGNLAQNDGLRTYALTWNLLNIPALGPDALAVSFCAAVHALSSDKGLLQRASQLVTDMQGLAKGRNQIVHGEWMIGPEVVIISDSEELPLVNRIKRQTGKLGAGVTEQPTLEEFAALIERCRAEATEVQAIGNELMAATYAMPEEPAT